MLRDNVKKESLNVQKKEESLFRIYLDFLGVVGI